MDTPGYAANLLNAFALGQAGASQTQIANTIAQAGATFAGTFIVSTTVTCSCGGGTGTGGVS